MFDSFFVKYYVAMADPNCIFCKYYVSGPNGYAERGFKCKQDQSVTTPVETKVSFFKECDSSDFHKCKIYNQITGQNMDEIIINKFPCLGQKENFEFLDID